MIEEFLISHGLDFLDLIVHTWFSTIPIVSITSKLNTYLPIISGVLSDLYYFIPKDLFVTFAGYALGFMIVRIILAIINLIWW